MIIHNVVIRALSRMAFDYCQRNLLLWIVTN